MHNLPSFWTVFALRMEGEGNAFGASSEMVFAFFALPASRDLYNIKGYTRSRCGTLLR